MINSPPSAPPVPSIKASSPPELSNQDLDVILDPSPIWTRLLLWGIFVLFGTVGAWAALAELDVAIQSTGKLEPKAAIQDIQAPIPGRVTNLYVKEGQQVKKGDLLLRLDPAVDKARELSLEDLQDRLQQENKAYSLLLSSQVNASPFLPEIQQLFTTTQLDLQSRLATARLRTEQLKIQLTQTQDQLLSAIALKDSNQSILDDVKPISEEGAISRLQVLRQEQQVLRDQVEVDRLIQEKSRLELEIKQSLEETIGIQTAADRELTGRITENQKRLTELRGQLQQNEVSLNYRDIVAPLSGIVFDLRPKGTSFVINTSESLLKIVPDDNLRAKVFISNRDIGFVKPGLYVEIRIDAFPYREFGDIAGTVSQVGSDVLPPDQIRPFFSFPVEIELDNQYLKIQDKNIKLQSGMAVSANIRIRRRSVLTILTDMITPQVETLRFVR